MNVKSHNNISKWQMGFNSAFKGLRIKLNPLTMRNFRLISVTRNGLGTVRGTLHS
jgi:hypothetical protein